MISLSIANIRGELGNKMIKKAQPIAEAVLISLGLASVALAVPVAIVFSVL
ncbi:MAG: hypothetical protein P8K27_06995 [Gammaproteobacteria bacterium]|nr:hypothetical protein [Gammaproteobacteria bacterium]